MSSFIQRIKTPALREPGYTSDASGLASAISNMYKKQITDENRSAELQENKDRLANAMAIAKLREDAANKRNAATIAAQNARTNRKYANDKKKNNAILAAVGDIYKPVEDTINTTETVEDKNNIVGQKHEDQKATDFWTSHKGQAIAAKVKPLQYREDEQYRDLYTQYANLGSKYKNQSELQDAQNKFIEQHPKMFGLKGDEFDKWKNQTGIESVAGVAADSGVTPLAKGTLNLLTEWNPFYHIINNNEEKEATKRMIDGLDFGKTLRAVDTNMIKDNPYEQARKRVNALSSHLKVNDGIIANNNKVEQEVNTIEKQFYKPVYGKKDISKHTLKSNKDYYKETYAKFKPILDNIVNDANLNTYEKVAKIKVARKAMDDSLSNHNAKIQAIKEIKAQQTKDKKKKADYIFEKAIDTKYKVLEKVQIDNNKLKNELIKLRSKKVKSEEDLLRIQKLQQDLKKGDLTIKKLMKDLATNNK